MTNRLAAFRAWQIAPDYAPRKLSDLLALGDKPSDMIATSFLSSVQHEELTQIVLNVLTGRNSGCERAPLSKSSKNLGGTCGGF